MPIADNTMKHVCLLRTIPGGGGGGGGGGHSGTAGLILRPLHVLDFVKEFCTKVRSMGGKIPLQSMKYTRL